MDENPTLTLCHELYRFAKGDPGMGVANLIRTAEICEKIYERGPNLVLLKHLRRLQTLMSDWTAPRGWMNYGHGPIVLRGELVETISAIAEAAGPRRAPPLPTLRRPVAVGGALR
ncbi:hypothetical protein [Solimonas sp. SE-A11]|uniref:hypothetical protein n=1 Tax=Solimonas sp. SE-A11 TaxID=3054954 RepID=UPI00259CE592|nr:hypothetical protein [Solimonas sp. SE-A11]MDM4768996.1 hypothetical protein [Solimonas sp. SE-A11]